MNLGVSFIPFDQVGVGQRISVGLRSRIELHGILEIVDSTVDDVISRFADSSPSAVLAAQAFQHDADLLFNGMMLACVSANIPDCVFSALRYALARLSHRCSSAGLR